MDAGSVKSVAPTTTRDQVKRKALKTGAFFHFWRVKAGPCHKHRAANTQWKQA